MTTIGDFLKAFVHQWTQVDHSHVFDFDENHIRLWDFYNKSRYALLKDLSMPLHEANITEKQYMIFEFKEVFFFFFLNLFTLLRLLLLFFLKTFLVG